MPRLSCIIPVVGDNHGLESTLVSVLEHRPEACEILVVLNAAYDDPYQLKDEIRFIEAPGSSWVACATVGIRVSRAPVVHVLATGCEVTAGWAEAAIARFEDATIGAVAPQILDSNNHEKLLAAGVAYHRGGRRKVLKQIADASGAQEILGPTFDAAFFRKRALETVGDGLPAGLGNALADVDLALAMRAAGYRAEIEPDCRVFAPGLLAGPKSAYEEGLFAERLFWRNASVSGGKSAVWAHALVAIADLLGAAPRGRTIGQFAGRLRGMMAADDYRLRRAWLKSLQEQAAARREDHASGAPSRGIRIDAPHEKAGASQTVGTSRGKASAPAHR